MHKILFAESQMYYKALGIKKELNDNFILEFDGVRKYKQKNMEFKKYSLIVSCLYHSPLSSFLIYKAKKANVPTLLIADGVFEWENAFNNPITKSYNIKLYHPIIHDSFLCLGEDEKMYFEGQGVNVETYLPQRVLNINNKVELNNNNKVLITTANSAYFSENEYIRLLGLINEIINKLNEKKINYIFRIFDSRIASDLKLTKDINFTDGSFKEVLKEVNIVFTTPSSIILESMYNDRAVCQLLYRDTPIFLQSGWNVSQSVDIGNTIDSIMSFDESRMDFQYHQLRKYLPTSSIETHIKNFIDNKRESQELYVNQNLYNLLNSKLNINLESIFRRVYLKLKQFTKLKKLLNLLRRKVN
ncbi:hypothetical protein ACRTEV_13045 [Rossellomorea arthrocnemi]